MKKKLGLLAVILIAVSIIIGYAVNNSSESKPECCGKCTPTACYK